MLVIPAIDLYKGNVVRLTKGDPAASKIYSTDPLSMALYWQDQGAKLLHLVDLDAALGQGDNVDIIKKIISSLDIEVEVGGGIRDVAKAQELVSLGAARIIIGTKGIDQNFLESLIEAVDREKIAIGVDVIDGYVATCGWKTKTQLSGFDFIGDLHSQGIKWVIYTDISRDGTLLGLDFDQIDKLSEFPNMKIIASGGVSSKQDIDRLKHKYPFIWGVISGKALYEHNIEFSEVITKTDQ